MDSHELDLKNDKDKQDIEYESDSDQGTSALALRRGVASDDEEDDREGNIGGQMNYDDEGAENHEGAPPAEDEEDAEEEEEEYEEGGEEYEEAEDDTGFNSRRSEEQGNEDGFEDTIRMPQGGLAHTARGGSKEGSSEEKKDAEPFVVPTAGAFYMHDDRFRYNGVARPRRSAGGRKLWEVKDEKPWVHDRFEELKLSEESYYQQGGRGRRGRGRQGRGYSRGDPELWRGRGSKGKAFEEPVKSSRRLRGRGRGLRRAKMDDYEFKESRSAVNNRYTSPSSHGTSGQSRNSTLGSAQKTAPLQPSINLQEATSKKPTISSMLNISSPPFFPTRTISQPMAGLVAGTNKAVEEKSGQRDVTQGGKVVNASRGDMEKETAGFSSTSVTRQSAVENRSLARGSSSSQPQQSTGQQRVVRGEPSSNRIVEQPPLSLAPQLSTRGTLPGTSPLHPQQLPSGLQQQPGKGAAQSSMRVPQLHHQVQAIIPGQISPGQPVQPPSLAASVPLAAKPAVDMKTVPPLIGNSVGNIALGTGAQAATALPAGRGSVVYGGSSLANGLRSVVQFAGQPQAGGLGVPGVGATLSGYSSQPQFSFPNSEVTWIPILAGGSSSYSSPYIAVEGGTPSAMYYTQQTTQASAFATSSGDANGSKMTTASSFKAPSRAEADELGQQRRRYSQMTFGEERR